MKNLSFNVRGKLKIQAFPQYFYHFKKCYLLILVLAIFIPWTATGIGFDYTFANSRDSVSGTDTFYLVDVMVATKTATPLKVGVGKVYFDYNELAFGPYLGLNPNTILVSNHTSYLLGTTEQNGFFNNYYYVQSGNDLTNTSNRFYAGWDQYVAEDCLLEEVTQTPRKLFGLKLKYIPGGASFFHDLCFSTDLSYIDQVYDPCGPFSGMNCTPGNLVADCLNSSGIQITPNNYFCSTSTGNEEPDSSFDYSVFPNPTSDQLTLELPAFQNASYQLFDLYGRLFDEGLFSERTTIDTEKLAVGTYYLRLSVGETNIVEKVIIAR